MKKTAAERHFNTEQNKINFPHAEQPLIWWQDPLTNFWSPGKLITWGRGYACISPGHGLQPVWIPSRRIKPYHEQACEASLDSRPQKEDDEGSSSHLRSNQTSNLRSWNLALHHSDYSHNWHRNHFITCIVQGLKASWVQPIKNYWRFNKIVHQLS